MNETKENNELTQYELELEKQRNAEIKAIELRERKHRINNLWCDYMAWIFEKYRDEFTETKLNVQFIAIRIFKNNKVEIVEDDIYKTFDKIIQGQEHVEDYLKHQRGKYSEQMPYQAVNKEGNN